MILSTQKGKNGGNGGTGLKDKMVLIVKPGKVAGTAEVSRFLGPHILLVEDDPMIRPTTREFFELNSCPATACGTIAARLKKRVKSCRKRRRVLSAAQCTFFCSVQNKMSVVTIGKNLNIIDRFIPKKFRYMSQYVVPCFGLQLNRRNSTC